MNDGESLVGPAVTHPMNVPCVLIVLAVCVVLQQIAQQMEQRADGEGQQQGGGSGGAAKEAWQQPRGPAQVRVWLWW